MRRFTVRVGTVFFCGVLFASFFSAIATAGEEQQYLVGTAKIEITPRHPTVLAGYGGRVGEHTSVEQTLWARALAIGEREAAVVIAVDNCGVPAQVVQQAAHRLRDATGLAPERLVVASTHTHNAPTLSGYAPILWQGRATEAQQQHTEQYTQWLVDRLVEVGRAALDARRPAQLAWGQGRVTFGGNRRVLQNGRWVNFGHQEDGPVDHSLPVLTARDAEDQIVAVWVNYACHCTTLGSPNTIAGDWAGFSNELLEKAFPQAVALTTIGCGADIGPQPTGDVQFARDHGQAIAEEVQRLVAADRLRPLSAPLHTRQRLIKLPLEAAPTREQLQQTAQGQGFEAQHAQLLLEQLERTGKLLDHVPYTISTWRFGDELGIVFLAGEVVVDYAVRLKTEMDWTRLWINGWSNDVPCYIPSRRLLGEGGYETDFSMIYYGQPARFAPEVEQVLVDAVKEELGEAFAPTAATPQPTMLAPPDRTALYREQFRARLAARNDKERAELARVAQLAVGSREGFAKLLGGDAESSQWFDHAGRQRPVHTLRQVAAGKTLRWETAAAGEANARHVFLFLGGLGWKSQPETAGFALLVEGKKVLEFDVTLESATWTSEKATLQYFPTWRSSEDSAGLFYLTLSPGEYTAGQPCQITVTSLGGGSQRWFSLHPVAEAKAVEQLIVEAVSRATP